VVSMEEPPSKRQALEARGAWEGAAADGSEEITHELMLMDLAHLIRHMQQERGLTTIMMASRGRMSMEELRCQRNMTDGAFAALTFAHWRLPEWQWIEALGEHRRWCNPQAERVASDRITWYEADNPEMEDLSTQSNLHDWELYRVMRFFTNVIGALIEHCKVVANTVIDAANKVSDRMTLVVTMAMNRYIHVISYIECLGQERAIGGLLQAIRSAEVDTLPPRIINILKVGYGKRQAFKEAFLVTRPSKELHEMFASADEAPDIVKSVEARILNNRPICRADDDWDRLPEEAPLVDPMEWYRQMSIRIENFRMVLRYVWQDVRSAFQKGGGSPRDAGTSGRGESHPVATSGVNVGTGGSSGMGSSSGGGEGRGGGRHTQGAGGGGQPAQQNAFNFDCDPGLDILDGSLHGDRIIKPMAVNSDTVQGPSFFSETGVQDGWFVHPRELVLTEQLWIRTSSSCAVFRGRFEHRSLVFKMCKDCKDTFTYGLLLHEIDILRSLKHPNIVNFAGASFDNKHGPLVMLEDCPGGSLEDVVSRAHTKLYRDAGISANIFGGLIRLPGGNTSYEELKLQEYGVDIVSLLKVGIDLMRAVSHIHSVTPPVLNLDIKPSNIHFDVAGNTKLGSFCFAKRLDASDRQLKTSGPVGTYRYMSPELALGKDYGFGADVYSAGVVCLYMLTGRCPHSGCTVGDVLHASSHGHHIVDQFESALCIGVDRNTMIPPPPSHASPYSSSSPSASFMSSFSNSSSAGSALSRAHTALDHTPLDGPSGLGWRRDDISKILRRFCQPNPLSRPTAHEGFIMLQKLHHLELQALSSAPAIARAELALGT